MSEKQTVDFSWPAFTTACFAAVGLFMGTGIGKAFDQDRFITECMSDGHAKYECRAYFDHGTLPRAKEPK